MLTFQERQNEMESQSETAGYLFKGKLLMGISAICQSQVDEGEALLNSLSDMEIEPNSVDQALGQWMSSVLVELYTKLGNMDSATFWSEKIQGLVTN